MLRMNQKFGWTRSELAKFTEVDNLECELSLICDDDLMPYEVVPGSDRDNQLKEMSEELTQLKKELRELMGKTRFYILMTDRFTNKAWRAEKCARYIKRHPEYEPEDCCPGWE